MIDNDMTEQEILKRQEENGNKEFYLMQVGMFYHTYGCGAFALKRVTGFKVISRHRKAGDIYTAGFHVDQLDVVLAKIEEAGGKVESIDEKLWLFGGIDGTPDMCLVQVPAKAERTTLNIVPPHSGAASANDACSGYVKSQRNRSEAGPSWLVEELLSYNLAITTPMEAMAFINALQKKLRNGTE